MSNDHDEEVLTLADYTCPECGVDFGYPQGLSIHKELGCEWGEDDGDFDDE